MYKNLLVAILLIYSCVTTYMLYQSSSKNSLANITYHRLNTLQQDLTKQNIIINALPKSGSAYIAQALESSLGYEHFRISNEYIPSDHLSYKRMQDFFNTPKRLSKQHMDASGINVQILKRFTDRMVLNVRDPRECLLSLVHHLNKEHTDGHDLYYIDPEPPAEYFSWGLQQQIDWSIQHYLPEMISWLQGWLKYKQQQDAKADGFKILITRYDELLSNEHELYNKIISFYGIPASDFHYNPPEKTAYLHFRKGDPNEWRTVFTPEQKQRIAEMVPQDLLREFGWQG